MSELEQSKLDRQVLYLMYQVLKWYNPAVTKS